MMKCIIKPLLLVCIMMLSVAARAAAGNVISIGTVEGKPGDTVELRIALANADNVSSVQVGIPIDSRLTLVENSAKAADRCAGHSVTAGVKDGMLNIFIYSMSMAEIAPGEGTVATVRLKLGNEPSDIVLHADKVVLTDKNGNTLPDATATDGNATILCAKAAYSSMLIDYGRVPIRSRYQQAVTVNNVGNAPLVVSGVEFSAAEFSCDEAFPTEIAAGSSKVFTLNYAPVERGAITEEAKFITNSIYKLNTVKLTALPFAVNELHVADASGIADSVVTISLRMNNMDDITGLQFDFNMPEQLEYVDGSFVLTGRKADHQLTVSLKDRMLRAIAFSLTDTPFSGNDGEIATFKVRLNGRYGTTLGAQKAVLTANIKGKETDVLSDKYPGYVNILSPSMSATGDISMGRTPITQEAKTAFSINNYGSAPLRIERIVTSSEHMKVGCTLPLVIDSWQSTDVDVVWDGVEEGDYSELLQLYTNDPDRRLHNIKVTGNRYSPNSITLSCADVEPGDTLKLHVSLSNNDIVNGVQFDLKYSADSFEPIDEYRCVGRADGYSLACRNIGKGHLRYFFYSLADKEISKGDGIVFTLLFKVKSSDSLGMYWFYADNILLSTPGLVNKYSDYGNNVQVNVIKSRRTVAVETLEHGKVEGCGTYDLGTEITLTAVPDDGYRFISWSDGNFDNPRKLIVDRNIILSAVCVPDTELADITLIDGKAYTNINIIDGVNIIYSRVVKNKYGTIVLPFVPEPNADVKYYMFSSADFDKSVVRLVEVSKPEANKPYIFIYQKEIADGEKPILTITANATTLCPNKLVENVRNEWTMQGTYDTVEKNGKTDDFFYVNAKNGVIYKAEGNTNFAPYRAWATYKGVANASALRIVVDGETTGIATVENDRVNLNMGTIYDIAGRRVTAPQHGNVYIVNGKKIKY